MASRRRKANRAEPPRLLVVHQGGEWYGSDRQLCTALRALKNTYEVDVILDSDGPLSAQLSKHVRSVSVMPLGVLRKSTVSSAAGIAKWALQTLIAFARISARLVRHRPALLMTNTSVLWAPALAAFTVRVPHIWYVHELLDSSSRLRRHAPSLQMRLSDKVVVCSKAVAAVYGSLPRAASKLVVLPNALDPEWACRLASTDAARTGEPATLLLVGRLSHRKGQSLAVEALKRVRARGIDARLRLVGEEFGQDGVEKSLRKLVNRCELDGFVEFLGYRRDPVEEYERSHVVLVPSVEPEAFGLTALEGMMSGRPVIASRTGGLAEIVSDGETGILVPPSDVDALTEGIAALLTQPKTTVRMGLAARQRAQELYSFDALSSRLGSALKEVRDKHGG